MMHPAWLWCTSMRTSISSLPWREPFWNRVYNKSWKFEIRYFRGPRQKESIVAIPNERDWEVRELTRVISRTNDSKEANEDRSLTSSRLGTTSFNTCRTVFRSELMVSTLESEGSPELRWSQRCVLSRTCYIDHTAPCEWRTCVRDAFACDYINQQPLPLPALLFLVRILASPVKALRTEPKWVRRRWNSNASPRWSRK